MELDSMRAVPEREARSSPARRSDARIQSWRVAEKRRCQSVRRSGSGHSVQPQIHEEGVVARDGAQQHADVAGLDRHAGFHPHRSGTAVQVGV